MYNCGLYPESVSFKRTLAIFTGGAIRISGLPAPSESRYLRVANLRNASINFDRILQIHAINELRAIRPVRNYFLPATADIPPRSSDSTINNSAGRPGRPHPFAIVCAGYHRIAVSGATPTISLRATVFSIAIV